MKRPTQPRAAFTLIELVVVMTIIILLATLTIAAIFRVRDGQRESNTNTQLRKAQMGLDQRWKATIERIKTEDVPQDIRELTKNANGSYDNARAKALHMKLRLRTEFPQTFTEADQAKFLAAYPAFALPANQNLLRLYGPKPLFSAVVSGVSDTADNESAVLLLLILGQTGGGITFDVESVGSVQQVQIGGPAGKMMRVYMDYYGQAPAFRRWADKVDGQLFPGLVDELSRPPFAPAGYADVQDPEGRLGPQQANNWLPGNRDIALTLFISQVANTRPRFEPYQNDPTKVNPFDGKNRGPYVFSAGKDGVYSNENDLFSFRLQATGKGGP